MFEGAFDVVVLSFRADAPEPLASVLERLLDVSQADARRLAASLPCVVREALPYAKAEALTASLSIAGAEALVRKAMPRVVEQEKPQLDAFAATLAGKAASALMQHARAEHVQVVKGVPSESARAQGPMVAPPSVLEPLRAQPANDVVPIGQAQELELDFALRPTEQPSERPKPRMSLLSVLASKLASRELKIPTLPPPEPPEPEVAPMYTKEQLDIAPIFPVAPKLSAPRLAAPPLRRESEMRLNAPEPRNVLHAPEPEQHARGRGFWPFARAVPAKDARPGFRPFTFSGGEVEPMTSRMVWLLAILWLSVGLLLWYHDIF